MTTALFIVSIVALTLLFLWLLLDIARGLEKAADICGMIGVFLAAVVCILSIINFGINF